MKVVLVGEAPARGTVMPFEGRSGHHLREIAGVNFDRLHLYNLLLRPQPREGRGFAFPYDRAQAEACRLMAEMPDGVILLLAGQRVAKAFGVRARYLEPCILESTSTVTYVVPHPSGGNRWYANEFNRFKARNFFEALFLVLDGVEREDGSVDSREFRVLARQGAIKAGRVF